MRKQGIYPVKSYMELTRSKILKSELAITKYQHRSAQFYFMGEHGFYPVMGYTEPVRIHLPKNMTVLKEY